MTKKIYGRKFRGNAMRFDYVDDSYNGRYDSNQEKLDTRKIFGDAVGLDDVDNEQDEFDDEESNGMRFHNIGENYESFRDHYHYTEKYRELHTISVI